MSDQQKENGLRIAAYLGNRLSPEEREAFKRELSENDELRLQYVDALMNKAGSGAEAGGRGVVEPGDGRVVEPGDGIAAEAGDEGRMEPDLSGDGVNAAEGGGEAVGREGASIGEREEVDREADVEHGEIGQGRDVERGEAGAVYEAGEAEWPEERKKAGGFLGSGWMVGVAALLLIVAGVVIYMLIRHQDFWDRAVAGAAVDSGKAEKQALQDPAMKVAVDSGAAGSGSGAGGAVKGAGATVAGGNGVLPDSIYEELYKPYMRGDDPGEVRGYYKDYKSGNYAAVLAAGDSSVKGVGQRALLVRDYMRLYVGLSYLATGDAKDAVTELEGVVLRTKPKDQLYEVARWYLALAWVRRGDADPAEARGKALGLARDISHSYSRYRESARVLIRALK